jgi:ATP/maltotriose-dependent transcriptional regulator MalT
MPLVVLRHACQIRAAIKAHFCEMLKSLLDAGHAPNRQSQFGTGPAYHRVSEINMKAELAAKSPTLKALAKGKDVAKDWRMPCYSSRGDCNSIAPQGGDAMIGLHEIKVTPRDQQVLNLLVQGCSNKEIAGQLNISPRTVKQHLRTLFLRAGIRDGRKRVKLAIAMYSGEEGKS